MLMTVGSSSETGSTDPSCISAAANTASIPSEQLMLPSLQAGLRNSSNSWSRIQKKGDAECTKGDTRGGMPLRRLWPADKSHQGRGIPGRTAAYGGIHVKAEEMSKKKKATKVKNKKQGVVKKPATH